MTLDLLAVWAGLTLGLTYLARDAEVFDPWRERLVERTGRMSRFVARMLVCAPCTAAWMAGPAMSLAVLVFLVLPSPWSWIVATMLVMPICAVGLVWLIAVLSPLQAAKRGDAGGETKKDGP